jgi:hypothetical protein
MFPSSARPVPVGPQGLATQGEGCVCKLGPPGAGRPVGPRHAGRGLRFQARPARCRSARRPPATQGEGYVSKLGRISVFEFRFSSFQFLICSYCFLVYLHECQD